MALSVVSIGLSVTVAGLTLFFGVLRTSGSLVGAQTLLFTFFVVAEMGVIQVIRHRFGSSILSNRWLVGAVVASLALQLVVLYTPLAAAFGVFGPDLGDWVWIGLAVTAVLGVNFLLSAAAERLLD